MFVHVYVHRFEALQIIRRLVHFEDPGTLTTECAVISVSKLFQDEYALEKGKACDFLEDSRLFLYTVNTRKPEMAPWPLIQSVGKAGLLTLHVVYSFHLMIGGQWDCG